MPPVDIDPLSQQEEAIAEAAIRKLVRNILASYPHSWDVLAEAIQNAVDEVTARADYAGDARPEVRVILDARQNTVMVEDNGRGIPRDQIENLLAPNVTDKAELF